MPTYSNSNQSSRPARRPGRNSKEENLPLPTRTGPIPAGRGGSRDNKQQKQARKMLMSPEQVSMLQNDLRVIGLYVNSRHLEMLAPSTSKNLYTSNVCRIDPVRKSRSGIEVYKVTKLMYNEEENSFEKLVSVYSALNSFGGIVALILQSDGDKTRLYMAANTSGKSNIAGSLLENNMRGQFPGCEINKLNENEKNTLLDSCGIRGRIPAGRTVRSLSMIPSRREDERQHDREYTSQGYEKFVDAMNGHRYTLVIISQRVSPDAMESCLEGLESLYSGISPYAKETATYGENDSDTVNYTISNNISNSVSHSISRSFGTSHTNNISSGNSTNSGRGFELFDIHFNSGSGRHTSSGYSSGTNSGSSDSASTSDTYGNSDSQSTGTTKGINRSMTMNRDNKAVQNLMAKIEEHIKRINMSQTFGMWNSACYMIADDVATATMGTSTLAALYSGDSQAAPRAYYNQWDATNPAEREKVLEYIRNLQHPVVDLTMYKEITDGSGTTTRSVYRTQQITPAMMISGKEIPTLMGLPRKSVPGIVVDSMAEFGRNIPEEWKKRVKRPVPFGNIYHMGQPEKTQTVIDLDAIASHVLICGASGSGKSNTTYNLLAEIIKNKVPFMVIEPAKGEYKTEFAGLPGINIFTVNESPYRLLQINPFEFIPGVNIKEHIDGIVQVISASWPLYGAMPSLLKQAFEQVYIDHGWDLDHSERIVQRGTKFPVFRDLVTVLEKIIEESEYSRQTKSDYKGALVNRVLSMCTGFEGQIFGRSIGVPDRVLFNESTIIDLSGLGSDDTRAIIMGVLIQKLKSYRKVTSTEPNSPLIHVTVLEEAHNILKRCSKEAGTETANIQGAAVASLCNSIAEMRSYGEGFMIIDQSPGAIDEVAITNTAIKITMKQQSSRDCEELGAAQTLKENQIRELSRLDVGVAAISHVGWTDTLLAKMGKIWDKRYRLKTQPVMSRTTYTRVQGAIVQLMYRCIITGDFRNMYSDVRELTDLLCKGRNAVNPVLPLPKQQQLLDEVRVFTEENDIYIKTGQRANLKQKFFEFVIYFLKLEGIMRIFPLKGIPDKIMDKRQFTASEKRTVVKWEKDVREAVARYLNMPQESDPDKLYKWPLSPYDAEFFMDIYVGVLTKYANRQSDAKHANAMAYLNSVKHFSRKGGKRP